MRYMILYLFAVLLLLAACAGFSKEEKPTPVSVIPQSETPQTQETFRLKRKIAVGRFSNETRLANSFLSEGSNTSARMSRQATDILSAKLAITNRFILIERQDTLAISNERRISNIGNLRIPADYFIIGAITDYGRSVTGNVGMVDRTKKQTAYAKVNLRIVDTRTGVVIYGEEGTGEAYSETGTILGMGSQAGFDGTLTDKAIEAAINSVINNLINRLSNEPWRSYVLNVEEGFAFISGGALQGIKIGDVFTVYRRGKLVDNPQTGIPIELPATQISKIKVQKILPGTELTELSLCEIISGDLSGDIKQMFVGEK
ncbi:MAG: CsgG/HfaB family protein [Candidatus Cloacimonadaceae bacterium]|nr:CsgG/HfaB family protein [Candidatus Cloacimonadaceae bacterium]MDP3114469.1 CsgG/HfaB family protein [Candidatus Cloacimonadaceae bacterium]